MPGIRKGLYLRLALAVALVWMAIAPPAAAQLPDSAGAPAVGEKAPDFTLPDSEGRAVRLHSLLEQQGEPRWVLLIFYRGYW